MDDARKPDKRHKITGRFKQKKRHKVSDPSATATMGMRNDPTTSHDTTIQSLRMQATEASEWMVIENADVRDPASPSTEVDTMRGSTRNPLLPGGSQSFSGSAVRLDSRNATKRYLDAAKLLDQPRQILGRKMELVRFARIKRRT